MAARRSDPGATALNERGRTWIQEAVPRVPSLTARQREVLMCLGQGLATRDIALRLFLTEHTVKIHTSRVLEKLGVETRLQAGIVGYAYSLSLLKGASEDSSNG